MNNAAGDAVQGISPAWISAFVSLGWLALAVAILFLLYPIVIRIVKERTFTVEIAGFKLSAQDTVESLNSAIKDLQESVRRLESTVPAAAATSIDDMKTAAAARGGSILWVDDYPINNALVFEKLESDGIRVDRSLSTREGLKLFGQRSYDIVLSDMGRKEDGQEVPDAGVVLTQAIRKTGAKVPIFVYCSNRARDLHGQSALDAGANNVTSSAVELYGFIEEALQKSKTS